MTRKEHWERVYATREPHEVSWTQDIPATSLGFIHRLQLPATARIIDVGGGESRLVDHLLDRGYERITVLDISENALRRARDRLGAAAERVEWIVSDITEFTPTGRYDVWHDRATFHFLTRPDLVERYIATAYRATSRSLIIGTFSTSGPERCSGLDVQRYDRTLLASRMERRFIPVECVTEDHVTPFGTHQNFLFCRFDRLAE